MKNFFRFLVMVVCLVITINLSYAQWIQTNGPFGGYVNTLAVSGTTLYAGCANGSIYRSIDLGVSWTLLNAGMTKSSIHVLAVSGTSIYAGTDLGELWIEASAWKSSSDLCGRRLRLRSLCRNIS